MRPVEYDNRPAVPETIHVERNSNNNNNNNNQAVENNRDSLHLLPPSTSSSSSHMFFHSEGHLVIPRNDIPEANNLNDAHSLDLLLDNHSSSVIVTSAHINHTTAPPTNSVPRQNQDGSGTSRSDSFLGGTQQTYSMTIENMGPSTFPGLKPKKLLQAMSEPNQSYFT